MRRPRLDEKPAPKWLGRTIFVVVGVIFILAGLSDMRLWPERRVAHPLVLEGGRWPRDNPKMKLGGSPPLSDDIGSPIISAVCAERVGLLSCFVLPPLQSRLASHSIHNL